MHNHIFIPSSKKDICYCKICQQLSYKGIPSQSLPLKNNSKFSIDPLNFKFKPFSSITNYKLENHLKYLQYKNIGISKINYLINNFGLKSMIFYKAITLMDQIYLQNEVSTDDIETIASVCVLLVVQFNECCLSYMKENNLTKNEKDIFYHSFFGNNDKVHRKANIRGLFKYIKNNVNNFKYWEVLCLSYLNYDLGKYSAYDYLILFFQLGIFFCKDSIDIIDKLNICFKILDYIVIDTKSCDFSQYTIAMSIIKVAFEFEKYFDKNIFKKIYGVDLSKKKYINCSKMIKTILFLSKNISNLNNYNYDMTLNINYNILNNFSFINGYNNNIISFFFENKNNKNKKKNKNKEKKDKFTHQNELLNSNFNSNLVKENNEKYKYDLSQIQKGNLSNKIIINNNFISNSININNYNFYFQNYSKSKINYYFFNNVNSFTNQYRAFNKNI